MGGAVGFGARRRGRCGIRIPDRQAAGGVWFRFRLAIRLLRRIGRLAGAGGRRRRRIRVSMWRRMRAYPGAFTAGTMGRKTVTGPGIVWRRRRCQRVGVWWDGCGFGLVGIVIILTGGFAWKDPNRGGGLGKYCYFGEVYWGSGEF